MPLSVSGAAIAGFRLIGRRPASFLTWILLEALTAGAFAAAIAWSLGLGGDGSVLVSIAAGLRLALIAIAGLAVLLTVQVIIATAALRAVLRPSATGLAYLRLGAAEGRYFGYYLLILCVGLAAMAGMIAAVVAVSAAPLLIWAKALIGAAIVLVGLAVWMAVAVRWCLAGPIVVAEGRLDLGRSWRLTGRWFWPLLGVVLLAAILAAAAALPFNMMMRPAVMALQMSIANHSVWSPTPANLGLAALALVGLALSGTIQRVAIIAPLAAAYRHVAGAEGAAGAPQAQD